MQNPINVHVARAVASDRQRRAQQARRIQSADRSPPIRRSAAHAAARIAVRIDSEGARRAIA